MENRVLQLIIRGNKTSRARGWTFVETDTSLQKRLRKIQELEMQQIRILTVALA